MEILTATPRFAPLALLAFAACISPTQSAISDDPPAPLSVTPVELGGIAIAIPEPEIEFIEAETLETVKFAEREPGFEIEVAIPVTFEEAPKNDDSRELLERSARGGSTEAQLTLGNLLRGDDASEAVRWWHAAAEANSAVAQCQLGLLYLSGEGVGMDEDAAFAWFCSAAQQEDPVAQHNLGLMYAQGRGVQRNGIESQDWIKRAAENGNAESNMLLGNLNANSYPVAAYCYYLIADQLGHEGAEAHHELLAGQLCEADRQAAQSSADRWIAEARKKRPLNLARLFQQEVEQVVHEARVHRQSEMVVEEEEHALPIDRALKSGTPFAAHALVH